MKNWFINFCRQIFCSQDFKVESEDFKEIKMKKSISEKNNHFSQAKNYSQRLKNNKPHSRRKT